MKLKHPLLTLGLIIAYSLSSAYAANFPPPESTNTCQAAKALADQVNGQLSTATVASYESYAVNVCRKELGEEHPDTLTSMSKLAKSYGALGQHDKAVVLREQTLRLRRAKLGDDHPDTLRSMNDLANSYSDLGQHDKALVLQEQTLQLRRAKLGDDHPDTLVSMNNLANSYSYLGQHDKAMVLQEQTLRLRRAKLGDEHLDTLVSMNNLAACYSYLGQHDKAVVLREQTLQLMRAKLGDEHPNTLSAMSNLAISYSDLGQYDKAVALREQTFQLRRAKLGDEHPDTLSAMNNLAASYTDLGQHDKAVVLKEQTLQLMRAKLGNEHPDTLSAMNNLAASYSDLGQSDKAVVLREQTLQLRRAKLGDDHPDTLSTMSDLAISYNDIGQHDKAVVLREQTLQLRRAKLGDEHPDTLSAMNNLAISYSALGQHEKAAGLNEKTLQLRRAKLGDEHPDTLSSMSNLANSYSALGEHDKAVVLKEQTLQLRRAKLGDMHPNTLISMNNLAASYSDLGQYDKAAALIPSIQQGAERLRALPNLSTEQKQSLFAKYSDNYQFYSRLYIRTQNPAAAFDIADLSKARTLGDSVRAQAALRSLSEAEQAQLQNAQARLVAATAALDKLAGQPKVQTAALLAAQKNIEAQRIQYNELSVSLKSRYPKYAQLIDINAASTQDAPRLLLAGEVFISYLINSKGEAQVFIIDRTGKPQWLDLGKLPNHKATVAAYRELVSPSTAQSAQGQLVVLKDGGYQWLLSQVELPNDAQVVTGTNGNPTEALRVLNAYWYERLIKPILPIADAYTRWIISPDKDLALLPFDALPASLNTQGAVAQNLAQTRQTTLVQSFSVYALLKAREAENVTLKWPKELFAMGNAVYGEGWAESRGMSRGKGTEAFRIADASLLQSLRSGAAVDGDLRAAGELRAMRDLIWQNLPGTGRELDAVSTVFQGGASKQSVDTLVGENATESKLQALNASGALQNYRYLLFSAHGYLAQNPALSALVLSQKGNPPEVDGYVTAAEWLLYDLKSDLTVLSACDTGVGKTQAGEGVMGLPYALFVAGNKNTLLSLWPVDDDATAEFMRTFFAKLKAGMSQPQALTETKRDFMRSPEWSSPRYWAAFVLYGV